MARDVMEGSSAFGALAKRLDLPKPLDSIAENSRGYASDNTRHGLERQQVDTPEAELIETGEHADEDVGADPV